jgi:hypothetical protein
MRLLSLLLLFCLPLAAYPAILQAEARASNEQQAKREALAALADSILVNVQSEFSSYVEGNGKRQDELRIRSRSDVPLIGVDLSCLPIGNVVLCEAKLDSAKSLTIYTRKLEELRREIGETDVRTTKANSNKRYAQLIQLLTLTEQYEKYHAVAQMLGETQFTPLAITRAAIQEQLRALEEFTPSLDLAAQIISKGLSSEGIYIYPAVPQGSHEVTAFGRVFYDRLAQRLNPVTSPDKASHFLKGEYELLNNSLYLTYRLLDDRGNTLATRIATLAPAAYKGMQVKPATVEFDRLLHEGVVLGNDFKAQLNSNRGSENVLFDEGEEVELFVKLSRPGYFYVVGHVIKKGENYSYLLELSETEGDRRFTRYVNADDVNKWLSIGRFEATAPFGIESLQLISSSDDPINRLPAHPIDAKNDLYVTASDARVGIAKTRALKHKSSIGDKQYQAEAVLMFTTMPKH